MVKWIDNLMFLTFVVSSFLFIGEILLATMMPGAAGISSGLNEVAAMSGGYVVARLITRHIS